MPKIIPETQNHSTDGAKIAIINDIKIAKLLIWIVFLAPKIPAIIAVFIMFPFFVLKDSIALKVFFEKLTIPWALAILVVCFFLLTNDALLEAY